MIRSFEKKKKKKKTEIDPANESDSTLTNKNKCYVEVQKMIDVKNRVFKDDDEEEVDIDLIFCLLYMRLG